MKKPSKFKKYIPTVFGLAIPFLLFFLMSSDSLSLVQKILIMTVLMLVYNAVYYWVDFESGKLLSVAIAPGILVCIYLLYLLYTWV